MIVGDTVRVLEPFSKAFPDAYLIEALEGSTATILGDRQFDVKFLEVTNKAAIEYVPPEKQPVEDQIAKLRDQISGFQKQLDALAVLAVQATK